MLWQLLRAGRKDESKPPAGLEKVCHLTTKEKEWSPMFTISTYQSGRKS
jgi:hypothetical protein